MSSIPAVNRAAAESVAAGNEGMIALLVTGLELTHILQVYTSSMVAVAVWDWLTCLSMEWRYIWKKNLTVIKGLYLWTRYYGLVCFALNLWLFNANFSKDQCATLHYLIAATCMWTTLGSEAILALRTYAFLGKQRILGIVLGTLLVGETGFLLYVAIAAVHQIDPFPIGDMKGPCTASDKPGKHIVSGFWLAPVAFDLVCTFLTLWKAMHIQDVLKTSRIIQIFIGEGLGYFLAVAGVNVLNAAFMFQKNPNLQNINCFLALVLSQVLCCRLVLNLMGAREDSGGYSSSHLGSGARTHPNSTAVTPIPLLNFRKPTGTEISHNDFHDGVKVQVDVERRKKRSQSSDHADCDMKTSLYHDSSQAV